MSYLEKIPPNKSHCHYCNRMTFSETAEQAAQNLRHCARRTRDHTVPNSLGGTRIVLSCDGCNNIKNDSPYQVFKFFVASRPNEFRVMNTQTREILRKDYNKFVYNLTLSGFVASRAIAIRERSINTLKWMKKC